MGKKALVLKNAYYDSAFLMLVSKAVKGISGIKEAALVMATEINLAVLGEIGLLDPREISASPNDLIVAMEGESEDILEHALTEAKDLLQRRRRRIEDEEEYRPVGLEGAIRIMPDANLAIISVPGLYAGREARKALDQGLHVMLFSDQVPLEQEIELKKLACRKGLLMMGPDCGTAIINGKPLCFANVVRRGRIGVVAASGSGLQELTCLIHHLGGGISQAIGTGGRDLRIEVGGMMTVMGIEALDSDPGTEVICVISKPPAPQVAERVIERLGKTRKPSVVHFVGLRTNMKSDRIRFAGDLEETAATAVALSPGRCDGGTRAPEPDMDRILEQETTNMAKGQRYLRGLYAGGTLADEAMMVFEKEGYEIYSNIQADPSKMLKDPRVSFRHTVVDLGDDLFTMGRPHPMIDSSTRADRIQREMEDPEVAVLLLDFVLGYGSNEDPCGSMLGPLKRAKDKARERGGYLSVITSITGTDQDPQDREEQRKRLESVGCVVMPSNVRAASLALRIIRKVTVS